MSVRIFREGISNTGKSSVFSRKSGFKAAINSCTSLGHSQRYQFLRKMERIARAIDTWQRPICSSGKPQLGPPNKRAMMKAVYTPQLPSPFEPINIHPLSIRDRRFLTKIGVIVFESTRIDKDLQYNARIISSSCAFFFGPMIFRSIAVGLNAGTVVGAVSKSIFVMSKSGGCSTLDNHSDGYRDSHRMVVP